MLELETIKETFENHTPIGESWAHHYAVILPLVDLDDGKGPQILYEVRAKDLDRQPGEICFPGGQIEDGETPLEAALLYKKTGYDFLMFSDHNAVHDREMWITERNHHRHTFLEANARR